MNLEELDAQVADLQSRCAFQEDSLQAMAAEIEAQRRQIQTLERAMTAFRDNFDAMLQLWDQGPADTPPPHY